MSAHFHPFPDFVTVLHENRLPVRAKPAGYAALIDAFDLKVPPPRHLFATHPGKQRRLETPEWTILSSGYAPADALEDHLAFALRYEPLDLTVLKRLFLATGPDPIVDWVITSPTGRYTRRAWFLYEWLTGKELALPNVTAGNYEPVVGKLQFGIPGIRSARHRVINNLPGTPLFCPLVTRTPKLEAYIGKNLAGEAASAIAKVPKDLLARTAAFLLLKDSRSSYAIEGERPPQNRIQRWGRAIAEAGKTPLDLDDLLRLQKVVIGDDRFVPLGLRTEGGFIGEHDRSTGMPLPDHIDARPQDLASLVDGLIAFDNGAALELDPVIAAAVLAFGFVYIHPFEDGNGRLHRYLIHHTLSRRGFSPPGIVFPVSATILDRITAYVETLETYSKRLLPYIEWQPTPRNNVEVLNDTADFYRYFDATPHAEFLFEAVETTIFESLPKEAQFLAAHDRFREGLQNIVDMPERTVNLLFRFLNQNHGKLSQRARAQEFASLRADEIEDIEQLYSVLFDFDGYTLPIPRSFQS